MKSSSPEANVSSGKSVSINELAKTMIRISGYDLEPLYEEERKGHVKYIVADTTRARNILRFAAKDELESGLKQLMLGSYPMSNRKNSSSPS